MSWDDIFDSCKFSKYEKGCICKKKDIKIEPSEDCKDCILYTDEVAEEMKYKIKAEKIL